MAKICSFVVLLTVLRVASGKFLVVNQLKHTINERKRITDTL